MASDTTLQDIKHLS